LEVIVITIFFPRSPFPGVYVNVNGDDVARDELTEPCPFSVIITIVALPPNVLPPTVTGPIPQVLPAVLLKVMVGGFTHCPRISGEINKNRPAK
jgi:hypothetical protein